MPSLIRRSFGPKVRPSQGHHDNDDDATSNQLLVTTRQSKRFKDISGAIAGPRNSRSHHKNQVPVLAQAGRLGESAVSGAECHNDLVPNFRPARGLQNVIFRCGQTDDLIHRVEERQPTTATGRQCASNILSEQVLLYDAGLVIDLRSPPERDSKSATAWMSMAPGGTYEVQNHQFQIRKPRQERTCLRLTPLPAERFYHYIDTHWLDAQEKARTALFKLTGDVGALHQMRINAMNRRGLVGMYQAILEVGKSELCEALRAIALHLEYAYREEEEGIKKMMATMMNHHHLATSSRKKKLIVVHCVQGKDRTGILIMLLQSILKIGDVDILLDYALSDPTDKEATSAAVLQAQSGTPKVAWGSLDHSAFLGAPKSVMKQTLQYLRDRYGSVSPGYLDNIGFNAVWRKRLQLAVAAVTGDEDDEIVLNQDL